MLNSKILQDINPLHATIQREVIKVGGGSIDEDEFNLAYVRQMDLFSNVLNADKVKDYTLEDLDNMEKILINITKGGANG